MESVEVRDLNDRAAGWPLHSPRHRRILLQREVRAPLVIVVHEASEGAPKGAFIPDDDVIETFAPQGPDQTFHERILPSAARCDHNLLGAKTLSQTAEVRSVGAVSVPNHIRGGGVVWKGFSDLLPRPSGRRMLG